MPYMDATLSMRVMHLRDRRLQLSAQGMSLIHVQVWMSCKSQSIEQGVPSAEVRVRAPA
jgi:hypothetical protein